MMKKPRFLLIAWLVATITLALSATTEAATIRYDFAQDGFDEGATLSGYFDVTDLPPVGIATALDPAVFPGGSLAEITGFQVSFSGNSLVAAFTHGLSDLSALVYVLGSPNLGDQGNEAIATNVLGTATRYDYYSGIGFGGWGGAVTDNLTGAISRSDNLVQITAVTPVTVPSVPVPAAFWLFGGALAMIARFVRITRQ